VGRSRRIESSMKRILLTSTLLMFALGCSQQRAADTSNNEPQQDPAAQQRARDKGEQLGQKARELDERTKPEREKLARETSKAAEKLKQGTLKLGDRAAAAAEGMKQGWNKNRNGQPQVVDINSANTRELQSLPGMTLRKARLIISSRPYSSTQDLVSKGLLSRAEYDQIKGRITVNSQSAKQ
jgi:DNA uptake protein ComE-like DNA-binding protein